LSQSEIILTVENVDPVALFGENNNKLNLIRKSYPDTTITSRGSLLKITGKKKDTQAIKEKVEWMVKLLKERKELSLQTVEELLLGDNPYQQIATPQESKMVLVHGREGRVIYAKTKNQQLLVEASAQNDVVFAIGPAGTGKTYTAVALAVRALKNKEVKKIILTRPVESGCGAVAFRHSLIRFRPFRLAVPK